MPKQTKNICGPRIKIARTRKNMRQIDVSVALEEYEIMFNQTVVGSSITKVSLQLFHLYRKSF